MLTNWLTIKGKLKFPMFIIFVTYCDSYTLCAIKINTFIYVSIFKAHFKRFWAFTNFKRLLLTQTLKKCTFITFFRFSSETWVGNFGPDFRKNINVLNTPWILLHFNLNETRIETNWLKKMLKVSVAENKGFRHILSGFWF